MPGLAMKSDSITADSIEGVGPKAFTSDSHSGLSVPSSSRAILTLTENLPTGPEENPPNIHAALKNLGERMDRILDASQNQAKTLQGHGKSLKTQGAALALQGNALKKHGNLLKEHQDRLKKQEEMLREQDGTLKDYKNALGMHSMVIMNLFQNQQRLLEDVEKLKKHVLVLKQNETKLALVESRSEGSNSLLPVPISFSSNKSNGMIAARLCPFGPYGIMQPSFQFIFKDIGNLQ